MDSAEGAREKARRHIAIADRMLTQTYPLLQDPKLFIAVVENIFLGIVDEMAALLYKEGSIDKNSNVDGNPEAILLEFSKKSPKYDFEDFEQFLEEIKQLRYSHKKSPVEFARKESYVMCSRDYDCTTLSEEKLKSFIKTSRLFMEKIDRILAKGMTAKELLK